MDYFVGAVVTLIVIVVTRVLITADIKKNNKIEVVYSQSNVYELIRPFIPDNIVRELEPTQSSKHYDKIFTKIMVVDDKAYWIKDNTFFTANIIDGDVDRENAAPVDTMAMDKVQLDKMIFIIETLTKGNFNDYRDSR
jgi:hypothetical protein